jgi:phage terminase large subunit-like protein
MGDRLIDHVVEALDYANRVVAGDVPACKWVKAACQRQLDDLIRAETDPDYPFRFDASLAARAITFIELLRHVKGKWGGQRITLEAWQKFSTVCVFGWIRKVDGTRRFRTVYEEVPRKNAKTTRLGAIGLKQLVDDSEWGAEVYSAATTRDQANIVFDIMQQMARMDGDFRARFGVEVLTHSILVKDTASKARPLSAEGSTLDGLNVSCALIDELHAHKTRAVHDVLDSATGSRSQPLIWKITTAGSNRAGVCYDQRTYLTKILNSTLKRHGGMGHKVSGDCVEDDGFWGIIYTIDDGDDPLEEATWRKANPNYGISVDPEDLRRMANVARTQSASLNEFLTKRLNVWINADAAWMNMLAWDACARPGMTDVDLEGAECWIGLDAAFRKDFFAKLKIFRVGSEIRIFGRYYCPQALLDRKGNEQLLGWAADGWIRTTPGDVLDIQIVREELDEDLKRFNVKAAAFDPWQLTSFASDQLEAGAPMVELRPLTQHFSEPMKEVERMVAAGELVHQGDPVLGWMMSNVVCHTDAKDNVYPRKEKPEQKIDGPIALLMALNRMLAPDESDPQPFIAVLG